MAYESPYGKPEGIGPRLADWAKLMGTDKMLPWKGLGLIYDLQQAAAMLGGPAAPSARLTVETLREAKGEVFAELAQTPRSTNDPVLVNTDAVEDWERALPAPVGEYDL